ncbi:MAG: hypothetical protein IKP38_09825, partial [Clostridia bacterium]|nr:hypothetical protein [Clostridia bacterium]
MKRLGCFLLALLMICLHISTAAGENGFTVSYAIPGGQPESRLTDADVMTRLTLNRWQKLTLTMSNAGEGRKLYLEWFSLPTDAVIEQFDTKNALLNTVSFASPDRYAEEIQIDPACVKITLSAQGAECTVSTFYVSDQAPGPDRGWLSETPEACDILVIAPTPADVMEVFGPTIVKYASGLNVSVGVLCMTVDYRYRLAELQRAFTELGIENAPIALGIVDNNYSEYPETKIAADRKAQIKEVKKCWETNNSVPKLREKIERLRPKMILTVDQSDRDLRAAETYSLVTAALQEGSSVQKLYVASDLGTTRIDCTEPMPALGGRTAHKAASEAYRLMDSRGMYRIQLDETPAYRLEKQTVGSDSEGNDLLEHIPVASLISYNEPTPAPTEAPTPEPTEAPTPEPIPETTEADNKPSSDVFVIIEEEELTPEPTSAPVQTAAAQQSQSANKSGWFSCRGGNDSQVSVEIEATPTPAPEATAAPT